MVHFPLILAALFVTRVVNGQPPAPMIPSVAPVSSPAPPCPEVPTTGCSVCGVGECVIFPDELFIFPGQPVLSCCALETAGLDGRIPLDQCAFLPEVIRETCCYVATPPPISPTPPTPPPVVGAACPDVPTFGCSVCGHDSVCITIPDGVFVFPGQPPIECSVIQNSGLNGEIPLDQCPFLPPLIGGVCGCQSPTPAPTTTSPTALSPTPAPPSTSTPTTPAPSLAVPTPGPPTFPPYNCLPSSGGVPTNCQPIPFVFPTPGPSKLPTCNSLPSSGGVPTNCQPFPLPTPIPTFVVTTVSPTAAENSMPSGDKGGKMGMMGAGMGMMSKKGRRTTTGGTDTLHGGI